MIGPQLPFSDELHGEKYRGKGEDFRESQNRGANAMKDDEGHYQVLREIFLAQRYMAAGRVQAAMGSTRNITAHNCFLSGVVEDDSGIIFDRLKEAFFTMRRGGGIGYGFSHIRPRGDLIKSIGSKASGPISFMGIFDASCRTVASSGHRRGAQMGVLRIDHPDIEEFIRAKQNTTELTGFNLSVAVTDEFMNCLMEDRPFPLKFNGQTYREVNPKALWETLMRSTWDWAEPGVLFIDTINKRNNLYYCEEIEATNPCGEQPLPPYGACLLGSFNLTKYLDRVGIQKYIFDWDQFGVDIEPVVRGMDNVIDRAQYPLYSQEKEAKSKRRMGLGVTGLANAIEALGFPYGSDGFLQYENDILQRLCWDSYRASIGLAKEKGSFPLFNRDKYLQSEFVKTLPDDIQQGRVLV